MRSFGADPSTLEVNAGDPFIKGFEDHRIVEVLSLISTNSSDIAAESAESDYDDERDECKPSYGSQSTEMSRQSVKEVIEKLRRMRTALHDQIASDASIISEISKQKDNESVVSDLDGSFCLPPNRGKFHHEEQEENRKAQGGKKGALGQLINRGRRKKEGSFEESGEGQITEVIGVVPREFTIESGSNHQKQRKTERRELQQRDDGAQYRAQEENRSGSKPPLFPRNRRRWLGKCGPKLEQMDQLTESTGNNGLERPVETLTAPNVQPNVMSSPSQSSGKDIFFDPDENRDSTVSNLERHRSVEEREGPPGTRSEEIGSPLIDLVRRVKSEEIRRSTSNEGIERKAVDEDQKLGDAPPLSYISSISKSGSKPEEESNVSSGSSTEPRISMSSGGDAVSRGGAESAHSMKSVDNSFDDELSELMGTGINVKNGANQARREPREHVVSPFFDFFWCLYP